MKIEIIQPAEIQKRDEKVQSYEDGFQQMIDTLSKMTEKEIKAKLAERGITLKNFINSNSIIKGNIESEKHILSKTDGSNYYKPIQLS